MSACYRFITFSLTYGRSFSGPAAAVILSLLPLLALAGGPGWQPGFSTPGLNGSVHRVVQWRGRIFVAGGDFTDAGGQPAADHVARWNGRRWQALGEELNGGVNAVAVAPDGRVYIGGAFEGAGGTPRADDVARWDGRRWQALGAGLNRNVHALVIAPNGTIIGGGDFTATGDEALPVWHGGMYREP